MSRFGPNEGRIDADAAIAYARATNDPNDIYLRGEAVPPLFTTALIQSGFVDAESTRAAAEAIRGARAGVHAQHDVRFHGALRPGDAVGWIDTPHGARQTPAGVLATRRIVVSDLNERPVVEHLWSSMHIGGTIDADVGPVLDDHTFPPEARSHPLGAMTFEITADQSFRYAGASGDRNPHSVDDDAARREGFPRKLLQGLCTLAMCSGAVVALGAGGDPDRLRRLAGRFAAPVFLRQNLTVQLYGAGAGADGNRIIAFEAIAGGTTVIRHGRAELHPE